MPLSLSLNSDCLKFAALPITDPPCDREHPSQTPLSSCNCPQPLGHCSASSRYFCTFVLVTQGMGRHRPTKNKQNKTNYGGDSSKCISAGLEQIPPKVFLCSAMQEWQPEGPGSPEEQGREPHTWAGAWLNIPSQPPAQAASVGHGSTLNPAGVESLFCYKSKEKTPHSSQRFLKSLSISSTGTKLNELLCFHIL